MITMVTLSIGNDENNDHDDNSDRNNDLQSGFDD